MIYYQVEKNDKGEMLLREPSGDRRYLQKTETVFSQCNGYLGIRGAYEVRQLEESRGTFLGGFYHRAGTSEVSEMVNCPDVTEFKIYIEGRSFYPDTVPVLEFGRWLNVMTGELHTDIRYDLSELGTMRMETRRFASHHDSSLFCHEVTLTFDRECRVVIETGIDGRITNSGVSHIERAEALVFDKELMYARFQCDDGQRLQMVTLCHVDSDLPEKRSFYLERRSVYEWIEETAKAGQPVTVRKYTIFDRHETEKELLAARVRQAGTAGYDQLFSRHKQVMDQFWYYSRIEIDGASLEEEGAIAFAQYHLFGMVPKNTSAYSVGAKGLTGEGYKGHVFWDTEMFVMPFFTSLFPEISKNLLSYRYERLEGAKKKAEAWGYEGALYPWESAATGEEETPLYAALNIHTGKANQVWSGIKEHHVTADIILALRDYCRVTGDDEFLLEAGSEMIFETACFWYSRAVYQKEKDRYEILDVIGPDEYTEHVDNNAYTNYLVYENVKLALKLLEEKNCRCSSFYQERGWNEAWSHLLDKLYLPEPNEKYIIPQDDTFLMKPELPQIETYRRSKIKQEILKDYSREEVVNMQVLKQADLVMLLNLMPELFPEDVIKENVRYYEARSVHDSSLSYCAHASACAQIGDTELAYHFFQKAMEVDLDTNETDSKDGIHAAALGGILNCLIEGFAGIRFTEDGITVRPHLPENWKGMTLHRKYKGRYYKIRICGEQVSIEPLKRGFIFDLDGVIVDTARYHYLAWRDLAKELGFEFPIQYNQRLKGVSRMDSLEVVLEVGGLHGLSSEEKEALAERKNNCYLEMIRNINSSHILPGIEDFLKQIRQEGWLIALGSASKSGEMILNRLGLRPLFDVVVDGRLVSKAKPDPEVFLTAAKLLGLSPGDCIVVEDARAGVEAAKAGAMKCIGIGEEDELLNADRILCDTGELAACDYTSLWAEG